MSLIKASILVVISVLFFTLVYSSFSAFHVFAVPPAAGYLSSDADCEEPPAGDIGPVMCCWTESATEPFGIKFCQTCAAYGSPYDCGAVWTVYPELKQPPPPPGPGAPPGSIPEGGGVLPELEQIPPSPPQSGETAPEVSPPTISPEDSQGDDQSGTDGGTGGGGGVRPPVNDLLPETGIEEQPEVQQPEQEQPSNEGQDTGGPLT